MADRLFGATVSAPEVLRYWVPMSKTTIHPIILCGGSGTRLWPLSRQQFPKQFVPLINGESLLTLTARRLSPLIEPGQAITLLTAAEHRFQARDAVQRAGFDARLILEPTGRNTAAAIIAAALDLQTSLADDAMMLVVPADNYIPDHQAFARAVRSGLTKAFEDWWVIAGVAPTYPATGYGYIALDASPRAMSELTETAHAYAVRSFIEKPSRERAEEMLLAGGYFWNAGIFLVKVSTVITSAKAYCADSLQAVRKAIDTSSQSQDNDLLLGAAFKSAPNISIDYAVLEKHPQVAMVPFAGAWSDVGSWTSVAEITCKPDQDGNRLHGAAIALAGSKENFVYGGTRPIVMLGVEDLVVVDTDDALLVAHQSVVEQVKEAVAELDRRGFDQAKSHRRVVRPWGTYDSIDSGDRFLVKRITVNPGASLSLQLHHHRAEHWIVVRGTARVTRGDEVYLVGENQSTFIPLGVKHRLENPGKLLLEMIEVQSGSYLSEDDIVRFSDQYGRA